MLGLALQASAAALKQRDQRIEALESDFAAMLAKLDEIEQRLPAA
jgi:Tfp pilus assembly protein PilN